MSSGSLAHHRGGRQVSAESVQSQEQPDIYFEILCRQAGYVRRDGILIRPGLIFTVRNDLSMGAPQANPQSAFNLKFIWGKSDMTRCVQKMKGGGGVCVNECRVIEGFRM